jgi:hypothetical protein
MKKNDLIKSLTEIEGNPEIIIWNAQLNDYMYLDFIKAE